MGEQRLVSLLVQIDCEQLAHALHIARGGLEDEVPRTRLICSHADATPIERPLWSKRTVDGG